MNLGEERSSSILGLDEVAGTYSDVKQVPGFQTTDKGLSVLSGPKKKRAAIVSRPAGQTRMS